MRYAQVSRESESKIESMPSLLLAIDTSGKNGSLALACTTAGESEIDLLEAAPLAGGTFSAQLIPQIAAMLEKHGYTKSDLEAFAVVTGPGSFTGLRVGLAAIIALAEALQKPIAAISMLEAIARSSTAGDRTVAVIDAGRGDVYVGDYDLDPQVTSHSERLLSREDFVRGVLNLGRQSVRVVTADPALAEHLRASGIDVRTVDHPDATCIARFGWEHLQKGKVVHPEDLEANYIRRSDAEIFAKPIA